MFKSFNTQVGGGIITYKSFPCLTTCVENCWNTNSADLYRYTRSWSL